MGITKYEVSLLKQKGEVEIETEVSGGKSSTDLKFSANLGAGLSLFPQFRGEIAYHIRSLFPCEDIGSFREASYEGFEYWDGPPGKEKSWSCDGKVLQRSDGIQTEVNHPFVDPLFLVAQLHRLPKGFNDFYVLIGRKFHLLTVSKRKDGSGQIRGEDREIDFETDEEGVKSLKMSLFPMVSLQIKRMD